MPSPSRPIPTPSPALAVGPGRRGWLVSRRRWVLKSLTALVVVALLVVVVAVRPDNRMGPGFPVLPVGGWFSGASGPGVVDGEFADWRGRPVTIAGTWSDNNADMTELWQLQPDFEYADWRGPMDLAIGAIGEGETWAEAADGAYDDRWKETLTQARDLWQGRWGTLYLRFAHEMNGNWYPWAVTASDRANFVAAWQRFRNLQQSIMPQAQLVFCLNRESIGTGFDWRQSFPGAQYVDVLGVDYYNQYPYVATEDDWRESMDGTDEWGAPTGLEGYLEFARSVGLPLAVPEWSGVAEQGDSPVFVEQMYGFFSEHAGQGAGDLLYEILFNVDSADSDSNFALSGRTRMPQSAEAYRGLWRLG